MKKYIKSSIILLAALALTSCSKTEEFRHNAANALEITSVSGISPFALMQEPASKAVITGETLPGDEATKGIGLFVTATDGTAYDGKTTGYSNVKYAYSSEKWSAASPIYLSNTAGKLYGYFPYNVDAANLTAIPVVSSLNGTDYLYATSQDVSFSNKSVNLQMNHALARLHLTIKKGDKYLSDCNLSKIILQSKAIDASGTMDITTGIVSATKAADATGTFTLTGTDAVTKTGIEKDILLVPADNSEGKKDITLTLTIDGVDAEVNFTADKGLDIRSGIQNNVTLTIEDTGIKVTGVGVGEWGEGFSQQVEVNSHKVTVKLANDIPASNVTFNVYVEGLSVKIIAFPIISQGLICKISGSANCDRTRDYRDIHTFTVSEIQSDVIATIEQAPLPSGALKGVFTVADDGNGHVKKVHFSQGNLYYDGSVKAFKFESNQYNFHTYDSSSNTWGLFGWSTSETYGMSTSTTDSDYSGNFVDWGTAIDNKGTWTTLSGGESGEWEYLFDHHVNIWGTCNSVTGLFIAPDNFVGGTAALSAIISDWKTAQDAGIVFLPAAGYRDGSNVSNVGGRGFYWSSSAHDEDQTYYAFFYIYGVPPGRSSRFYGYSVRLITESY